MRRSKSAGWAVMAAFALAMAGAPAFAEPQAAPDSTIMPSTTKGPYYDHSENELRARKLARGVANIGLCVAEIPNQAFQEAYKTSPITGTVVGIFKGAWKGAKRLAVGTWEVLTFFHPTKNNYKPYIEPEVVFMEYQH